MELDDALRTHKLLFILVDSIGVQTAINVCQAKPDKQSVSWHKFDSLKDFDYVGFENSLLCLIGNGAFLVVDADDWDSSEEIQVPISDLKDCVLGFSGNNSQYKIFIGSSTTGSYLFSSKSREWEVINQVFPASSYPLAFDFKETIRAAKQVGEILFWPAISRLNSRTYDVIVSFDIKEKSYGVVIPALKDKCITNLGNIDHQLAVTFSGSKLHWQPFSTYSVYLYAPQSGEWQHHFDFPPVSYRHLDSYEYFQPIMFCDNSVVLETCKQHLYLMNLSTGKLRKCAGVWNLGDAELKRWKYLLPYIPRQKPKRENGDALGNKM